MGKLQQDAGILNEGDALRAMIAECEKLLATVSTANAAALMEHATDAHALLDKLERAGSDTRSEQSRLDTIDERIVKNAKRIVSASGGTLAFIALRQRLAVGDASNERWWRLDDVLAEQRTAQIRKLAIAGAVVIVLGIAAYLARGVLFPPDPVGDALVAAQRALGQNDTATALSAIDAGLTIVPTNTQLLVWRGAVLELRGDPTAVDMFAQARARAGDKTFLLERAQADLVLGNNDRPIADLTALIVIDPNAPEAYFLRATAFENKRQFDRAMADLETAADTAQRAGNDTLYATARVRLGTLMQAAVQQRSTAVP